MLDIYNTGNLPKTLAMAREDGFRIIGAASSLPKGADDDSPLYNLQDIPSVDDDHPTLLVLGSEGHGLRTLVSKLCTEFVRIPSGDEMAASTEEQDDEEGEEDSAVDSLNVSVTGGILLWHLLYGSFSR